MPNAGYKAAWAIAAVIVAAYGLVFLQFAPPALQDYPNHVARALVMSDLLFHGGVRFGATFQYNFLAVPYILNDLLLASAMELLGVKIAACTWSLLVFLSLPCAMLFYMHVAKIRREDQIFAFLLSLYLATNTFYLRGFLAFSLAVAVIVVVSALVRLLRERPSPALFAVYCTVLGLGYLIHLTTLIFAAAAIAVSSTLRVWRRTANVRTEVLIFLPIIALLIWHFAVPHPVPGLVVSIGYYSGTVIGKIQNLDWNFIRFNPHTDRWMLWLCIACILWQARHLRTRGAFATPHVIEMFALMATFLGLYIVLPLNLATASWVDVRALPMIAIFVIMAALAPLDAGRLPKGTLGTALGLLAAALLAAVNLVYINTHLYQLDAGLSEYRAVAAAVPSGAWVFPVYTNTRDRRVKSTLHAAAFTVIDRGAPNPYLFSSDLGDPMVYFRYRQKPYAPDEMWYLEPATQGVNWQAIARSYDFLLVMKPFDPMRIQIPTTPIFENAAAALLAIDSHRLSAR
jgi:hypothetical protein